MSKWLLGYADLLGRALPRLRPYGVYLLYGVWFRRFGKNSKLFGIEAATIDDGVCVGDFCWIEAVTQYADETYSPQLILGERVAISDLTHISCVKRIIIEKDCLIGSKVYIGDHSHGSLTNCEEILNVPPSRRKLGDAEDIVIGEKTWICDGAVILAGTSIAASSIVAANSVVRIRESRPALIAGAPARVIRYFDEENQSKFRLPGQ